MRLLPSGLPLLALLTLAALAAWRVSPAPLAQPVLSPAGGPRAAPGLLFLEPPALDLGVVAPASRHETRLAWRREGAGPLRLLAQDLGCGCLGLTGLPEVLPQGGSGSATLTLGASVEPGPIDTYVRLVLDRPAPDDVLRVPVAAYVGRQMVVRPAWLDLGRRTPASRSAARFAVHLPPGADPAEVAVEVVGWPGVVRVERSPLRGRRGPDLVLDSTFPARPGALTGALAVRTPGAGEALVSLRAAVVEPARLSAGGSRPGPCPPW